MSSAEGVELVLVTPANWLVLDLDPATSARSIRRMVRELVGTGDHLEPARRQIAQALTDSVRDARQEGAFFAAVASDVIDGLPVSASALAVLAPAVTGEDGGPLTDPEAMATQLSGGGRGAAPSAVELGVGRGVRVRSRTGSGMRGSDGTELETDTVQYFVPLPDGEQMLVLSFSTPSLAVADALAELFDAMAASAHWEPCS